MTGTTAFVLALCGAFVGAVLCVLHALHPFIWLPL